MAAPRILIVEDDNAIRTLIVSALKREPLEVHTAGDGLVALECVRANDYAVILLDLMMPRLDGYEFLESLETVRPNFQPVIIVMTAFDSGAIGRLPARKVHAVLHKPFDVERVVDLVRDCAALYRKEHAERPTLSYHWDMPSDDESRVC